MSGRTGKCQAQSVQLSLIIYNLVKYTGNCNVLCPGHLKRRKKHMYNLQRCKEYIGFIQMRSQLAFWNSSQLIIGNCGADFPVYIPKSQLGTAN